MGKDNLIRRGTGDYRRANLALFFAGFVTFSTLYDFQPLFPNLVSEFAISPTVASLTLSFATFALAWTLPLSGTLSDALGRRPLMGVAVILTSLLTLVTATLDSLPAILVLRLMQGIVLAGVPAVAMAYLSEEIEPRSVGNAMGLYIAGNAFGGMTGRILTAWLTDFIPWRSAIGVIAAISLVLGVFFLILLPPSRNFQRRPFHLGQLTASLVNHLRNPGLLCLYLVAFTCMGGFVTLYNYVTFRLLGPDFGLSQTEVALIFLAYAFGAFGSSFIGALVHRFGRGRLLFYSLAIMTAGLALTLLAALPAVIAGIVIFTIGFFGVHSVASTWVGFLATHSRGQASSLYLFFYYLGSSISGTAGGFFYGAWGWTGVVLLIFLLIGLAVLAGRRLASLSRGAESASPLCTPADCP
ncbi:putative arabinose efflux permease, MFS family [Desulfuromonas soudanensis]|uniref:Putative arabinose efflux permease, MFS family n=1 Tax=Desulfuromonas soudanensis TaxID=1603606 RepID=A0A0M4DF30_9BACT|nr:MFS transporter [Desulfuromonas soudanensis]ALC15045.1 putative arabinose efflux permease, MFS family [Desulfuromonas soudanensis]